MADSHPRFDPGWGGLEDAPLVFFDLEATGALPGDRIVEIGAVLVQRDEILESFQSFVNPEIEVPGAVREIHGIGEDVLSKAPLVREALSALFRFLDKARGLGVHHAPADMKFLAYDAHRAGLVLPDCPVLDTKVLARRMLGRKSPSSLYGLCERFGIDSEQDHRALPDAMCTHRLLRSLLREADRLESRYWSWPRPSSLREATLPSQSPLSSNASSASAGHSDVWEALEPRSPPHRIEIRYPCRGADRGRGRSVEWIEIRPLALVAGRRGPWLRACETESGNFKFYRLQMIQAVRDPSRGTR